MNLKKVNLTEEYLKIINDIDDTFYTNAVTGVDWYLKRYNENHTAIMLFNEDNEAVGYLASVPIKKELYYAISNGVIINDLYINPNMFINESYYNYIVSCVILDEYRNKGFGALMMKELLKKAKGCYIALTISNDGKMLAEKFLNLKLTIDESTAVFEKEF